jgi:3-hydroxybutyryl-CoA dehydrogenase
MPDVITYSNARQSSRIAAVSGSVVIVGTGRVAPGIAAAFAALGRDVVVAGRDEVRAKDCAAAAAELVHAHVRAGALGRETFRDATLVVETVVENLEVKQGLLERIEPWVDDATLIVSNTSSLPLDELAASLRDRTRFAGLHFLHPAHVTRVIEIVAATETSPQTIDALLELARHMEKRPIIVRRAVPGYVWNRLQMAMLRECLELVEQGVADAESVDAAVADGLAPRWLAAGPLATADAGGIATFHEIARQLFPSIASGTEPHDLLTQAQAGGGLYEWTDDERAALDPVRRDALEHGADIAARRPRPRPRG